VYPDSNTTYYVIVSDACSNNSGPVYISVNTMPAPVSTVCCDSTIVVGQTVHLDVTSSISGSVFSWAPSTGLSCDTCPTPNVSPTVTTTYTVTVTDKSDGCFVTDTVTITVGSNVLSFYNGITPNGDGHNDDWIIDNIELFPNNTVQIFNRWGIEVWKGFGYNNTTVVWNGRNSMNQPLPDATYFYIVTIDKAKYKGWVQLTR